MTLFEKLNLIQADQNSLVCVGIDPDRGDESQKKKIPSFLWEKFGEGNIFGVVTKFCIDVIDATAPHCCAFKPNLAFFEAFGIPGWQALYKVLDHIKQNYRNHVLVVDGKRNDIGNTAGKYAISLKNMGADVITTNPYMGCDTMEEYLKVGLGIFVLCLTSNAGVTDFQKLRFHHEVASDGSIMDLYAKVAVTVKQRFGQTGDAGLVVGATHPDELKKVRALVGDDMPFLIPGLGAQGGEAEATILANGKGLAIINTSRSVLYASDGEDYAEAAGSEAERTKNEINKYQAKMAKE